MPAYAKMSLVTSVFHPSDIAFVHSWSAVAPGYGGWHVRLDREEAPEQVSVLPPGAEEPPFVITKGPRDVALHRRRPGPEAGLEELQRFDNLRDAVLALCQISGEALEAIHTRLERDFPRRGR